MTLRILAAAATSLLFTGMAGAADIKVISTQAPMEAYRELVPLFEKTTGPSGVYIVSLFEKLGIADAVKSKLKQTPTGVFVGTIIASGDAEIGFQQVSELIHFKGIDYIGPLPADIQRFTIFSAGTVAGTKEIEAVNALVKFLSAPAAAPAFKKQGMDPA